MLLSLEERDSDETLLLELWEVFEELLNERLRLADTEDALDFSYFSGFERFFCTKSSSSESG